MFVYFGASVGHFNASCAKVSVANFDVSAARKLGRKQKKETGGRGRGEKETLADKLLEFEKPVRQRTGLVIYVNL